MIASRVSSFEALCALLYIRDAMRLYRSRESSREWLDSCDECSGMGRQHAVQREIESCEVGTWRREWRSGGIAVKWYGHPCDDPQRVWKIFTEWGVDEVPDAAMQESHVIPAEEALMFFASHR